MGKSPHFQQGQPPQPRTQGTKPAAPPVHWPHPASQTLQRKASPPAPPPALQPKSAPAPGPHAGQTPHRAVSPPANAHPVVQPKPAAPPVYWPHPSPQAVQRKAAGEKQQNTVQASAAAQPAVVQLACNCTKSGNKHASSCPANPKQKKRKNKEVKKVHEDSQSIKNLYSYDSAWAKKRGITEEMIKSYVNLYGKINGHATSRADKDAKRHENTTKDINQFHKWYNENYTEDL